MVVYDYVTNTCIKKPHKFFVSECPVQSASEETICFCAVVGYFLFYILKKSPNTFGRHTGWVYVYEYET